MDANKVEVNEAIIAESPKHECLWDVKARAYKDRNARENALGIICNYSDLFYIAKASLKSFSLYFLFSIFPFWNYYNGSCCSCKFLTHCTFS